MELSESDIKEANEVADLMIKIDNSDADYITSSLNEIRQYQPFMISVLAGIQIEVTDEELEEIMRIYFLLWEFFRNNKNVFEKKVIEADFQIIQNRQIDMLLYMEGEPTQKEKGEVVSYDFEKIKSRSLLAAVLLRYNESPVIVKMDMQMKGHIFIGIKSFIESFENL